MILYEKKIIYLSLYEEGVKKTSAGFMKVSRERDAYLLDIHMKCSMDLGDGTYALCVMGRSREINWGTIPVQNGRADAGKRFFVYENYARFGEEEFAEDDLCGIVIRLDRRRWVAGYWKEMDDLLAPSRESELCAAGEPKADEAPKEEMIRSRADEDMEEEQAQGRQVSCIGEMLPEAASEDKWEQLQRCYKTMHPFGDDRVFLSVEPKDFIILRAPYQRLVNNSFLLHGFYNYRHMILGPDKEIGEGDGTCFYLGVPGTYFEREKMVAIMFGFEGFECGGPVEVGKFGYYMRKVEL